MPELNEIKIKLKNFLIQLLLTENPQLLKEQLDFFDENTNFFTLGWSSLGAIKFSSFIFKEFGVNIELDEFFTMPTLSQISVLVQKKCEELFIETESLNQKKDEVIISSQLNFAQKGIWLYEAFYDDDKFQISTIQKLKGTLNLEKFNNSLRTIVENEEIFSLKTKTEKGVPYQFFEQSVFEELKLLDSEPIEKPCFAEKNYCFYLYKGNQNEEYFFKCIFDHLFFDDRTVNLFFEQLWKLYFSENEKPECKNKENNFLKYCSKEKVKEEDENFWKAHFEKAANPEKNLNFMLLNKETDFSETEDIKTFEYKIPDEKLSDIEALCKKNQISLFTGLYAYILISLKSVFSFDSLILSSAFSFAKGEFANVWGMFVNSQSFYFSFEANLSLETVALNLHHLFLEINRHNSLPFDEMKRRKIIPQKIINIAEDVSITIFDEKRKQFSDSFLVVENFQYEKKASDSKINFLLEREKDHINVTLNYEDKVLSKEQLKQLSLLRM